MGTSPRVSRAALSPSCCSRKQRVLNKHMERQRLHIGRAARGPLPPRVGVWPLGDGAFEVIGPVPERPGVRQRVAFVLGREAAETTYNTLGASYTPPFDAKNLYGTECTQRACFVCGLSGGTLSKCVICDTPMHEECAAYAGLPLRLHCRTCCAKVTTVLKSVPAETTRLLSDVYASSPLDYGRAMRSVLCMRSGAAGSS